MLAIQLSQQEQQIFTMCAKALGRSEEDCAREWILERLEDIEDTLLAEAVLKRRELGQEQTVSLEEVKRELGLEG